MKRAFILIHIFTTAIYAQFDPQVGSGAQFAIQKDTAIIKSWAVNCTVTRGLMNISDSNSGYTSFGQPGDATGKADGKIISLGDGGSAILTFNKPIANGAGPDFAIFENGFKATAPLAFLELAFVEVSSDGQNYFRFPAISNTDATVQTNGFGYTDASKLYNLAGKYIANYGTPFDLEELKTISGLDVNNITHVKIMDVVGNISPVYGTTDSENHMVNDPWPTPFTTCGFDLEAVAVIHEKIESITGISTIIAEQDIKAYPNPVKAGEVLVFNLTPAKVQIYDILGNEKKVSMDANKLNTYGLSTGIYWIAADKKRIKLVVE